jgi:hypothetical protein
VRFFRFRQGAKELCRTDELLGWALRHDCGELFTQWNPGGKAMPTHDVQNQAPPLVGYNLFTSDRALAEAVDAKRPAGSATRPAAGKDIRRQQRCLGAVRNNPPVLHTHDARAGASTGCVFTGLHADAAERRIRPSQFAVARRPPGGQRAALFRLAGRRAGQLPDLMTRRRAHAAAR